MPSALTRARDHSSFTNRGEAKWRWCSLLSLYFFYSSFSFPSIDPISSSATGKTKFVNITAILKTFQCTCTCIIGTHSVGVLEGAESYEAIKNGFSPLLAEINTIINKGVIQVNDQLYPLTFVIGGDYKVILIQTDIITMFQLQFLLMVYGLNAAHSKYACLFCHITKEKRFGIMINIQGCLTTNNFRYDTSIAPVVYQTEQARTLASIENCLHSRDKLGVKNKPLFNIETDKVCTILLP